MSRFENRVKIREIKKYVENKDYETAQRILDTVNLSQLNNRLDLGQIVEVYIFNKRYEDALEILYTMYDKLKTRNVIYQLINVSIKLKHYEEAEEFLREYIELDPEDFYIYIYKYKIDKGKGRSLDDLIQILERLKSIEYIDKWSYELAKLYYKTGKIEECKKECSDLILWFGDNPYAEKAKILLEYFDDSSDKNNIMKEIQKKISRTEEVE